VRWRYRAYTADGKASPPGAALEADDESAARRALWETLGYAVVTRLEPERPKPRDPLEALFGKPKGRVRRRDLARLCGQLAWVVETGVPLAQALAARRGATRDPAMGECLRSLEETVREGKPLWEGLARHPRIVPEVYVQYVRAGEETAKLPQALRRVAEDLERAEALRRNLGVGLIVPVSTALVAVVVVALVTRLVVPPIVQMFAAFQARLPWPTRALIAVTGWLGRYGAALLLSLGAAAAASVAAMRLSRRARIARDALLLRIPRLGALLRAAETAQYLRTFGGALESGVPWAAVVDLAAASLRNEDMRARMEARRDALLAGTGLAGAIQGTGAFPPEVAEAFASGEQSGQLARILPPLAKAMDEEVAAAQKALAEGLPIALTVVLGPIVIFIAIAVFAPTVSILSQIH